MYTKSFSLSITPSLISRDSSSCLLLALGAAVDVSLIYHFSEIYVADANIIYKVSYKIPHDLLTSCWKKLLVCAK